MVNFSTFQRIATAAVGAFILSTACVAAAVGPAASVETSSASYAAAQVQVSAQARV